MDTTFKSPESPHDIHRVACLDCHPKGVPKARPGARERARSQAGGLSAPPRCSGGGRAPSSTEPRYSPRTPVKTSWAPPTMPMAARIRVRSPIGCPLTPRARPSARAARPSARTTRPTSPAARGRPAERDDAGEAEAEHRPNGYFVSPPPRAPGRKRTALARKPTQLTSPRRNSVRSRTCFWNTSTTGRASRRKSAAPWRIGVSEIAFTRP